MAFLVGIAGQKGILYSDAFPEATQKATHFPRSMQYSNGGDTPIHFGVDGGVSDGRIASRDAHSTHTIRRRVLSGKASSQ